VAERAYTAEAVGLQATWVLIADKEDMDEIAEAILKIKHNLDELRARAEITSHSGARVDVQS
jgi:hypothetical protein